MGTKIKETGKCCFCGAEYSSCGNDIRPLVNERGNRCCNKCNNDIVAPNRLKFWNQFFFAIKDSNGQFINEYGLPTKKLTEALHFETEQQANHHIAIDQLFNCKPKKIEIYEEVD